MNWLKQNWIKVGLGVLVLGTILSIKGLNYISNNQTADISQATETSPSSSPMTQYQRVVLTGKIHWGMTYGRLLLENITPNSEYKYFVVDPPDMVEDGALRYSPMTRNIKSDEVVRVTGVINTADRCWDEIDDYKGCVPWVEVEKIEPVSAQGISPVVYTNQFSSLKWRTAKIKEQENCIKEDGETFCGPMIDIEYPQFIGGKEVRKLNSYIYGLVDKRLSGYKNNLQEWIKGDSYECKDANINTSAYLSNCTVQLLYSYTVGSIINGVVSIQLIFTDYTGSADGGRVEPIIINYDLKTDRILKPGELLCNTDNLGLVSILNTKLIEKNYSEVIAGYSPENILVDYDGITVVFPHYRIWTGFARLFVSYKDIPGVICLP
jgi:hypothetical protein